MPKETISVFLASTTDDLEEHGEAVAKVIEGMDMLPVRMHLLGAQDRTSVEACRDHAAAADALVVVLGHRYGWVPTVDQGGDGERSITWLEMAAAEAAGKPIFAFLVDEHEPWDADKEQDLLLTADTPAKAEAVRRAVFGLAKFKEQIQRRRPFWKFSNPSDLAYGVAISLIRHFLLPVPSSRQPARSSGGPSVVNQNSTIGVQVVARRIDALKLERRIDDLVHRLFDEPGKHQPPTAPRRRGAKKTS